MLAPEVLTPLAAFIVGLATSLHCTAMCGPLACALRVRPVEYHLSRVLSYSLAGALTGVVGQTAVNIFQGDSARMVPWALAAVLLAMAFGLGRRLPQPRILTAFLLRVRLNRSLGLLTPLLPCGPLWLMLGAAALTGSWWGGGLHMLCFATGTIPLPWLLQAQAARLQRRFSPSVLRWSQQGVAFLSAGVLIWRASLPLHACCH